MFQRHKINRMSGLVIRGREPVRCSRIARANPRSFGRRLELGKYRSACCVDTFRPVQLFHERRRREKFSIGAIEHVNITIPVCLHQQFPSCTLIDGVNQDWRFHRIKVEKVMRSELEIPLQFPGIRIESQHAIGVKVVSGTHPTLKVRRRITGAPINRIQLRIIGSGHPCSPSAVEIQFARPASGTELARGRYRPESPHQLATQCVVGGEESAHAVIAARGPHQNFVFNDQRSAGCAVIFVPIRVGHIPDKIARARIQAQEMRIVRFHVETVAPQSDPTCDMPRGIIDQSLRIRPRVMPHHSTTACVQSESII